MFKFNHFNQNVIQAQSERGDNFLLFIVNKNVDYKENKIIILKKLFKSFKKCSLKSIPNKKLKPERLRLETFRFNVTLISIVFK